MKRSFADKFICPIDKHELELRVFATDREYNIVEGVLNCTYCKRYYPIVHGVPMLSADKFSEPQLEKPMVERWEKSLHTTFA